MTHNKIKSVFFRGVSMILACACVCCSTACSGKTSDSKSSAESERIKLTDGLEKSTYQDYTPDVSGDEPVQLSSGCYMSSQVYATLDQESYILPGDSRFYLTMHNETGGKLSTDDYFELEILLDDVWYVVPPICDFTDIAIVDIGEEDTYAYDLSDIDVEFISGTYRVFKKYGEEKEDGKMMLIGAEFQLTVE